MAKVSLKILQTIGMILIIPILAITFNWYLIPTVISDVFGNWS